MYVRGSWGFLPFTLWAIFGILTFRGFSFVHIPLIPIDIWGRGAARIFFNTNLYEIDKNPAT